MHSDFIEKGWATEDQWSRINAPIGLDIFEDNPGDHGQHCCPTDCCKERQRQKKIGMKTVV